MTQTPEITKQTPPVIPNINNVDPKLELAKHQKKILILKTSFLILGLIFTLLCLARVPYAGSYLDGLVDYVLGQAKYAFYALVIFIIISFLFKLRTMQIIRSKKFIIFSILGLLCLGCVLSGIYGLIKYFKVNLTFTEWMNTYHSSWLEYFKSHDYSHYFNSLLSGGILAVLLSFVFSILSYAVLIVVALVLLLICIFIIFNINYKSSKLGLKLRGWMIRKLGGTFKYDGFNELKDKKENQNKFKKATLAEIELAAKNAETVPYDLLPETDFSHNNLNFRTASKKQARLMNLFIKHKIECIASDINVYATYNQIAFECRSKQELNKILDLQEEISKVLKLDHFNIKFKGNIISIESANEIYSKLSLRNVSLLIDKPQSNFAFFGLDKQSKMCCQSFANNPSALIVGKQGSGSATLAVLMALSACWSSSPKDLELELLNPNCEMTYNCLIDLPHTKGKVCDNSQDVTNKLHELQTIVNERNSLLKVNGVSNIEQYNKVVTNKELLFKYKLVLIPNFEAAIKDTFQNSGIIADLLVNGPRVGIYTILQSYHVGNEVLDENIMNNVSDKYILTLADQLESRKIFNSARGVQLFSPGDCLHYENKINNMERIQICNINANELAYDVDTIKSFWTAKTEAAVKKANEVNEAKQEEVHNEETVKDII